MERGANLLLHLSVEVDEDVPTGDEVDARKWRILQKAVPGEQHDVAQFARHAIMVAFAGKEAPQPFFRHVGFDGDRITTLPCDRQSALVEIGSKDLKPAPDLMTARLLKQQDRNRIGFLAGGAAGDPDANRVAKRPCRRTGEG